LRITRMLTVALAAGTLMFGATAVATSTPASAHTPETSSTCSTLAVNLKSYSMGSNGELINKVTVTVDSTVVAQSDFGTSFRASYPLGDPEVAHDYVVSIDAAGTQYDRDFTGTSVPCVAPTTPDAAADLLVAPATCDTYGSLVLGNVTNAAWGTPTALHGPAQYSVVATATKGHTFADGATTKTFTGVLEGALGTGVPECATIVVLPERPVPVQDVVDVTAVDCESDTQTTTTTTTTTDWMLDTVTNTWVTTPPVVTTSSATVAIAPIDCASVVTPPTGVTPPTAVTPPTGVTPPTAVTPPTVVTPVDPPVAATPPTAVTPTDTNVRAVPVRALASTGLDAGAVVPIGAGLLLAGAALVITRRLAAQRAAARD
jgi:hypothetical protein